jgi:hypothetical protein
VAQVVESPSLPSKSEFLSSNPSTAKGKKKAATTKSQVQDICPLSRGVILVCGARFALENENLLKASSPIASQPPHSPPSPVSGLSGGFPCSCLCGASFQVLPVSSPLSKATFLNYLSWASIVCLTALGENRPAPVKRKKEGVRCPMEPSGWWFSKEKNLRKSDWLGLNHLPSRWPWCLSGLWRGWRWKPGQPAPQE